MAISFPGISVTGSGTSQSPGITLPSAPQTDDIISVFVGHTTTGSYTTPSGWINPAGGNTGQNSDIHGAIYLYHRVTSAEAGASQVTWTLTNLFNASESYRITAFVIRGVATSSESAGFAYGFSNTNNATPHVVPSITPSANCTLVGGDASVGAGSTTKPSGWTTQVSGSSTCVVLQFTRTTDGTSGVATGTANCTPTTGDEYVTFCMGFIAAGGPATIEGTLSAALGGAASATGDLTHEATVAASLGGSSGAITGLVVHEATAVANGGFSASLTGDVTTPGGNVEAVLDAPLGGTASATATVTHEATGTSSFGGTATVTALVTKEASASSSFGGTAAATATHQGSMWISASELAGYATSGTAWTNVNTVATNYVSTSISYDNQNSVDGVNCLAAAIVYARTGSSTMRTKVRDAINSIANAAYVKTNLSPLGWARNITSWIVAADLIQLASYDPTVHENFRQFLMGMPHEPYSGDGGTDLYDLTNRANNIGIMARVAILAISLYVGDYTEVATMADLYQGWLLGPYSTYPFDYNTPDGSWQEDPTDLTTYRGIVDLGVVRDGNDFSGVIPDDYRRNGSYNSADYPGPNTTKYPWEAMAGILTMVELLRRNYASDALTWDDSAPQRAFDRLRQNYVDASADGWTWGITAGGGSDDRWVIYLGNKLYSSGYPVPSTTGAGRPLSWSDFTHPSSTTVEGTASSALGGTASATADLTHEVSAAGSLGGSAAITAVVAHEASATGSFGGVAAATATPFVEATANLADNVSLSMSGVVVHEATGAATGGFTAALTGDVSTPAGSTVEGLLDAQLGGSATAAAVPTVEAILTAGPYYPRFGVAFGATIIKEASASSSFGGQASAAAVDTHAATLTSSLGGTASLQATIAATVQATASSGLVFTATLIRQVYLIEAQALLAPLGGAGSASALLTRNAAGTASFGVECHMQGPGPKRNRRPSFLDVETRPPIRSRDPDNRTWLGRRTQ